MLYRFDEVHKAYGVHEVLRGATWQHNPGEHVGLVGRNGAGKTTMFKLLLKQEDAERGTIIRASGLTIGHLSQHLDAAAGTSMFDFVLAAFKDVLTIEEKMRRIEHDLADSTEGFDHDALLATYADLQHEYEHADGYTIHSEVERVLMGVGFSREEWNRPILEFSGGQQNRAMLARVLLTKVDLLLLDEPTNHLDLRGIEFLEEFLQSFPESYLLISHDRTFLNRTVQKIVELAHGKLIEYPGNYDRFLQLRGERMERMQTEYDRQQEFIDKTQDFIRRNLAGQKTKQAKSRRNMLARLDEMERPTTDETFARFDLDAGPRSGAIAMNADRLTAGYDDTPIVRDLSLTVRRGERLAIMGPNGSGKSTLLKTFAGRLKPLSGTLTLGHGVQVGYYDQTLGDLRPEKQVLDEIWDLDHSKMEEEIRSYLARFSFFADDVYKKVKALSGGEKGRLALAKIMYRGGNLLLLDEPTNHLDVYTREALEAALEMFTGALVVVSHDRYFVDRLAEQILLVEDGEADIHNGNYSDLINRIKEESTLIASNRAANNKPATKAASKPASKPASKSAIKPASKSAIKPVTAAAGAASNREDQRKRDRRLKKVADELQTIEQQIQVLEGERESNDRLLCDEEVYRDGDRSRQIQSRNEELRVEIASLYENWEDLSRERESLQLVEAE